MASSSIQKPVKLMDDVKGRKEKSQETVKQYYNQTPALS